MSHQISHINKEAEVMRIREIWDTNIHRVGVAEGKEKGTEKNTWRNNG